LISAHCAHIRLDAPGAQGYYIHSSEYKAPFCSNIVFNELYIILLYNREGYDTVNMTRNARENN
jgi:hypothetical protein